VGQATLDAYLVGLAPLPVPASAASTR
jgi:hypothetical protein